MGEFRTRRLALTQGLKLSTGEPHRVVVLSPAVDVLDVEDAHFNSARSVLLPELADTDGSTPTLDTRRITGLGVIYAALVHADKHQDQGVLVTGHTDAIGSESSNQSLSNERAKNVSLLLRGLRDDWRKQAAAKDAVDDYQTVLTWQHQRKGWDCDPGAVDNKLTAQTKQAITRFQELYNAEVDSAQSLGKDSPFKAKIGVDGSVGADTWGAIYDVYMSEVLDLLELDKYSELQARQAKLKAPEGMPNFVDCGEHIPFNPERRKEFDPRKHEHSDGPQQNPPDRRVEILFFDPGEEVPLVCHPKPGQCKPTDCPLYIKDPRKQRPIGIPQGLALGEINLRLTFVDPEGKVRPLPEGLEIEARFGDPKDDPGFIGSLDDLFGPEDPDASKADAEAETPAELPPGTDPDSESTQVDQEPNEKLGPDGRLRMTLPRVGSFYLRVLAGEQNCYVSADPKELGNQKLVTLEQALQDAAAGRVFFKLPTLFNTQKGYFEVPDAPAGVNFSNGSFLDFNSRKTQIGSREEPLELRLVIRWQYFQFEYFDRWTLSPTTVPQARTRGPDGKLGSPLVLDGTPALLRPEDRQTDTLASSAWEVLTDKRTTHCLAWIRRDISDEPVRELPDEKCMVRFRINRAFVRTDGDGKSADAPRAIVNFKSEDFTPDRPSGARMRLYDLPDEWRSTNYPARFSGTEMVNSKPFQELVATKSTLEKPYLISLDVIVIETDKNAPDTSTIWDNTRLENRYTLFDHELKVYKPDPESGDPCFTNQPVPPKNGVLLDFPPFTRLIARGVVLYDVFSFRTEVATEMKDSPMGARAARHFESAIDARNFWLSSPLFKAPRPFGTEGVGQIGDSIVALLRCSGHDGDVELFHVIQYCSVSFDFQPRPPHPKGAEPLSKAPDDAAELAKACLRKMADRWNGRDDVNSDPVSFEIAKPATARGRYTAFLVPGIKSTVDPRPNGEIHVRLYEELRAFQADSEGSWGIDALEPDGGRFTAAHEFGHVFACSDEYFNDDDEPSMERPTISEVGRSPATPYGGDSRAMMVGNIEMRARYFWNFLLFAHENSHFGDATEMAVVHGRRRYSPEITPLRNSRALFPALTVQDGKVGDRGLCDRFVYLMGKDEWTTGVLDGSSLANPFDGVIHVRVKLAVRFTNTSDFDDMVGMLQRTTTVVQEALNRQRKLCVRGIFQGAVVRLRVTFSPRFICETFPTDGDGEDYLKTRDPELPDLAAYDKRVKELIDSHGVHAKIRVVGDGTSSGVLNTSSPRDVLVRRDSRFLFIPTDSRYDDDSLKMFCQLVGLPSATIAGPASFLPLLESIPDLIVNVVEFLP